MTWLACLAVALVILLAGRQVAFYGDVLSEKTGLGRAFMGLFLVGIATSLPELFNVTSAALQGLPDIAVGNLKTSSQAVALSVGKSQKPRTCLCPPGVTPRAT